MEGRERDKNRKDGKGRKGNNNVHDRRMWVL